MRHSPSPNWTGDRGSVTLELAICFPVALVVLFSSVQAALWYNARGLALAAAQEGVRAARADGSTPGAGVARARYFLATHAGALLTDVHVSNVGSSATRIRIQVAGRSLAILSWPRIDVRQHASGPRERFTSPSLP